MVYVAHHLETPELIERYVTLTTSYLTEQGQDSAVCRDVQCAVREVEDADIVLCWKFPEELYAAAKILKWIQFGSAGIDHTLFPKLLESDIILTTVSGIHSTPVAEHVIGLTLALSRRIHLAIEQQIRGEWDRTPISHTACELSGKTMGIIGLGKIGLEIARLAKCLNMTVIGTKREVRGSLPNIDEALPPEKLESVLKQADVLVLVAPLTGGTRALLGARQLDDMKNGSFIINVARGQMIDHDSLIKQLQSGKISGAALDVLPQEPLPPNSPLWRAENVIITPHTAGSTPNYPDRAAEVFRRNLNAFLSGSTMINVFDRHRGY